MMCWRSFGVILALSLPVGAYAGRLNPEDTYNRHWCSARGGAAEVVLSDGTRADCLTPDGYAVEADFASKYSEGVGQALHYASVTGRYPGVLLIVEHPVRDARYVERLQTTLRSVCPSVRVWLITPEDLLD